VAPNWEPQPRHFVADPSPGCRRQEHARWPRSPPPSLRGGRKYSDPFFELELTADEDEMRVRDAFPPGGRKAGYEYDFGASWIHEITRQKAVRLDPEQVYPVCAAFSRDSPVEYPSEENPQDPGPFSLAEVNRKLARLGDG
jgi:hypothetical protein